VRRAPVVLLLVARAAFADNPMDAAAREVEAQHKAARACAAHEPTCDWVATYAPLERATLGRALAARGYEPDPHPWGKVIRKVHVFNEQVFAPGEPAVLRFLNIFHVTTRERSIIDELTIRDGEMWDQDKVEESARRLRDPQFSSVIATLPVKSGEDGKVDLFVVTRDVWSLRLNTYYTFQEGSLTNLQISLADNNFLGHRNLLAASLVMDQGAVALGPLFIDKNFLGRHLDLRFRVDDIFTRQRLVTDPLADPAHGTCDPSNPNFPCSTSEPVGAPRGIADGGGLHSEGTDSSISLSNPLWSLASEWGWGASFGHRFAPQREFVGLGMFAYQDPATHTLLPREYYLKRWNVAANAVRQWGHRYKFQVSLGHNVTSTTPSLLDTFNGAFPGVDFAAFKRDVFPRSEVTSTPFVGFLMFEPRYVTARNITSYEVAEDFQIGPSANAVFAAGLGFLGSTSTFANPSLSLGETVQWGNDGYVNVSASIAMRLQNTTLNDGVTPVGSIDNTASAQVYAVTPTLGQARIVAQASIATRWHDTQNAFLAIGSDSGLRGFDINQFIGQRRFSAQVEARTLSIPVWLLRFGGVAFYEVGGAADTFRTMQLYQDIGFGLRMLIPQTSRDLWRFDLAFPFGTTPASGILAPHFIAGFTSYF
jgi:hypothetical protein